MYSVFCAFLFPSIRVYIAYRIVPRVVIQITICRINPRFWPVLCQFWCTFFLNLLSSTYIFGKDRCFHPKFTCFFFKQQLFLPFLTSLFLYSYKSVFVGRKHSVFRRVENARYSVFISSMILKYFV